MMQLIDKLYVSQDAFNSDDELELIWSNIDIVNLCFEYYLNEDELLPDALYSYYVDYYTAQMNNGGFSQFIYNIGNNQMVLEYVQKGLEKIQAEGHLELFEQAVDAVNKLTEVELQQFLAGDYFGDDDTPQHHILNQIEEKFDELSDTTETLSELNSQWLKQHPLLTAIDDEQIEQLLHEIEQKIPDLEQRKQIAYENRPRYIKIIDALCEKMAMELESIHAGDPTFEYQGETYLAWYFSTNKGVFCMIELEDEQHAILFDADSETNLLDLDVKHIQ